MTVANVLRLIAVIAATMPAAGAEFAPLPGQMAPPPTKPVQEIAERAVRTDGLPAEERQCRDRLRALGVTFAEAEAIDGPEGCEAAHPLTVSTLPGKVALRPEAVLTCAMAEATARFLKDHAAPLAQSEFGRRLVSVEQASSYVCRPRRGTRKLSEHAFANALDWSAMVLTDGTRIDIRAHDPRKEPRAARLVSSLRKAACGPFATVLGPGSDADHADHFHFDMAARRNPFCQ